MPSCFMDIVCLNLKGQFMQNIALNVVITPEKYGDLR